MVAAPVVLVLLVAVVVLTRSSGEGAGVRVAMREYSFEPDPIVAEDGVVDLVNEGEIAHNFVVPELGKGSLELPPGGSQTLDLSDQPAGTYRAICDLTGHLEAGMETELRLG
jgi:plastocyanin